MTALVPMNEDEFQMYLEYSIQDYAQEHIKAGRWSEEEALEEATQEYQHLLPQGLQTPKHFLLMIVDDKLGKNVGILWFTLRERAGESTAFVYDVRIFEEFRRRGYASQAFQLLEKRVADLGANSIGLHVFGHNTAAREMYTGLGYVETNVQMVKQLSMDSKTVTS